MDDRPIEPFEYLHFARTEMLGSTHELCMSGVPGVDPAELPDDAPAAGEAAKDTGTGSPFAPAMGVDPLVEWQSLLAARYGFPESDLLPTLGTSGGVFVALAALTSLSGCRGPIAIEAPAYGVFAAGARFLGLPIVDIERARNDDYALDIDRVDAAFAAGARVFCLTDLHNPSGVLLDDATLADLRTCARKHDAWVLLDEVYRDFRPGPVGTGYVPGERVIVTSSLTKCYGLGAPRAGWLAGPAEVITAADHVMEILHGVYPEPSAALFIRALRSAEDLRRRGARVAQRARPTIDAWVATEERVSWVPPVGGITGLLQIEGLTDSRAVSQRLRSDLDVQVVPGAYFGAEGTLRVSFGLPPATLQRALETLALGIGALVR